MFSWEPNAQSKNLKNKNKTKNKNKKINKEENLEEVGVDLGG